MVGQASFRGFEEGSISIGNQVAAGRAADIGLKRRPGAWTYRGAVARSALQKHDWHVQSTGKNLEQRL